VLEGGWLAATPPLASAARRGNRGEARKRFSVSVTEHGAGLHIIPFISLPAAGILLLIARPCRQRLFRPSLPLALCFAFVELNEGALLGSRYARPPVGDTMSASGLLNTGGNIGGLIATPIVAYLSGQHSWTAGRFVVGCGFAFRECGPRGSWWTPTRPFRIAFGPEVALGLADAPNPPPIRQLPAWRRKRYDSPRHGSLRAAADVCRALNTKHPKFASGWRTASGIALQMGDAATALTTVEHGPWRSPPKDGRSLLQKGLCPSSAAPPE